MTEAISEPARIGPFLVLRKLGEGAMGVVYMGWDDQLERRVALKLVRRQLLNKARVRDRMIREAQAMARLSNPHVVQVYQVGEHDDGIYMAMEYVEGLTLGAWLKAEPRSWQAVLRTILEAGRGLVAAHSAGLVHRDFKPDNVLVDGDGQARVLDFGLVQADTGATTSDEPEEPFTGVILPPTSTPVSQTLGEAVERSSLHWSVRLTQVGNVLGTPAYMSPEQHFGEPAGPASDQFSFSVTLYEALYGVRPFGGDTWERIRALIKEGIVPPPPLESRVPRRIFKVLARGLAREPGARWPSLEAMLEALDHDPWRVRLRVAGMIGLVVGASAASYAVAATQVTTRCEGEPGQLAGVWDPGRKAEVGRAFAAAKVALAAEAWSRVEARLDTYAQSLVQARLAVCEAQAMGTQTSRLTDLRYACLGRRRAHLGALVEVLAAADASVVENAVQAAAALPSVASCNDEEALLTAASTPDDPEVAAKVDELRQEFARASALGNTGKYDAALAIVAEHRDEVVVLGYAPLSAEVALVEGRLLMNTGRPAEAEAVLSRALALGITHDLHALAAEAGAIRIFVVGAGLGSRQEALGAEAFVAPLVERARDDGVLRALFLNNLGIVHHTGGDLEQAQRSYERAIEVLRGRSVEDPLIAALQNNIGNLLLDQGRLDEALVWFSQAIESFSRMLGEGHPYVGHAFSGSGDVRRRMGDATAAIADYHRALSILEASYGTEHPFLLYVLPGLGRAAVDAGRLGEGGRGLARALAIAEKNGVKQREVGVAIEGLADIALREGAKEQARVLYGQAADAFDDALGKDCAEGVPAALRAGELAAELGDAGGATQWFERVLAKKPGLHAKARATAAMRLASALSGRGEALERACALAREAQESLGDDAGAADRAQILARCPSGG